MLNMSVRSITQQADPYCGVDGWKQSLDDEDEIEGPLESPHRVEDSLHKTVLLSDTKLLHCHQNQSLDRSVL